MNDKSEIIKSKFLKGYFTVNKNKIEKSCLVKNEIK